MRVLVVGATGAIGRPLVPLLAASGHEVIAASRHHRAAGPGADDSAAATPVALDLLDARAVEQVVARHRPDAIVHLATAIPPAIDPKRIGAQFATTNRLRTEGTRILLDAAAVAGHPRVILQGLAYAYEPGTGLRREDDPLWADPPPAFRPVVAALAEQERLAADAGATVLRVGHLYGPGTAYAPGGAVTAMVRRRRMPLVGDGAATFSFVHVDDAASAVLAALDAPHQGAFNVVDDHPVQVREWLPQFAEHLGARPPMRLPVWLARLAVGAYGVVFLDGLAGASNARARDVLRWRPRFPRFRDGIAADPGIAPAQRAASS